MIWEYPAISDSVTIKAARAKNCIYCNSPLTNLPGPSTSPDASSMFGNAQSTSEWVDVCMLCGWWRKMDCWEDPGMSSEDYYSVLSGAIGVLKKFDSDDIEAPIHEVRSYLAARYESRFRVHPKVFEDVVASVFQSLGYSARVTSYSGDGGIDVVLDSRDTTIGVQVKRYRAKIKVEQIRSVVGALVLSGKTDGIFVTTSSFQPAAYEAASKAMELGIRIDLVDARRFYDALELAQRSEYGTFYDSEAPFRSVATRTLRHESMHHGVSWDITED